MTFKGPEGNAMFGGDKAGMDNPRFQSGDALESGRFSAGREMSDNAWQNFQDGQDAVNEGSDWAKFFAENRWMHAEAIAGGEGSEGSAEGVIDREMLATLSREQREQMIERAEADKRQWMDSIEREEEEWNKFSVADVGKRYWK